MHNRYLFRLLDANLNRAREGIRTAEDYIRFMLGDHRWSKKLRVFRHQVTKIIRENISSEPLTAARRVRLDSGHPDKSETVPASSSPEAPAQVALRGLKRAQEALRVLEEHIRSHAPRASRAFSKLRFGLYEAEQWLAGGMERARRLREARLYVLLTEAGCSLGWEQTARAALKGGAGLLQLREKELDGATLLERAKRLQSLCEEHDALLIVNDRADVALAAGAAGVHLGQQDLAPGAVRGWVGESFLIGRSTHSPRQARRAVREEGADYIAVGSMYETATKPGFTLRGPLLAKEVSGMGLETPVFAIGGITVEQVRELRAAGVQSVAVSSAVIAAADPERAARDLLGALTE